MRTNYGKTVGGLVLLPSSINTKGLSMDETSRSLAARIERLERQNRRQRWLLIGLPAAALLLGASAVPVADWKGRSVTTEKLILVDGDGKERGAMYVSKDEPVLELYHRDHSLILNAGKSPENGVGFVQFFDATGKFKGGVGGNSLK